MLINLNSISENWNLVNDENHFSFLFRYKQKRGNGVIKTSGKSLVKLNQERKSEHLFLFFDLSFFACVLSIWDPAIKLCSLLFLILILHHHFSLLNRHYIDGHSSQAAGNIFLLIHSTKKIFSCEGRMKTRRRFIDFDVGWKIFIYDDGVESIIRIFMAARSISWILRPPLCDIIEPLSIPKRPLIRNKPPKSTTINRVERGSFHSVAFSEVFIFEFSNIPHSPELTELWIIFK